jgi:hypothetical protein
MESVVASRLLGTIISGSHQLREEAFMDALIVVGEFRAGV